MHTDKEYVPYHWFWSEAFWLPNGFHWKDFKTENQPSILDLFYYSIPISFFIVTLRRAFTHTISIPLGRFLGIEDTPKNEKNNNVCAKKEAYPSNCNQMKDKWTETVDTVTKSDLTANGINKNDITEEKTCKTSQQAKVATSTIMKFSETNWKFFWYSATTIYGIGFLWNQPWFWDVIECWTNFPLHNIPNPLKWYYIITTSFTLTQLLNPLNIPDKRDYWEHLIHDVSTLFLLTVSYASNLTKIGSLIVLIHEVGDIFLNFYKLSYYTKRKTLSDISILLFTFVWIVSRLLAFPYVIIYSMLYAPRTKDFHFYPAIYICTVMSITLLCLHLIWTFYILKVLKRVFPGKTNRVQNEEYLKAH